MDLDKKQLFLKKHIFKDLKNINDGFDSPTIYYFSKEDFKTVLERIEALGLGVVGIEPWKNGHFFDVLTHDDFGIENPINPKWYWQAFQKFVEMNENLQYAATYHTPKKRLTKQ